MLGTMYLKRGAWNLAQKQVQFVFNLSKLEKFEHIINNIDKTDLYTLIAMGNIYVACLRPDLMDANKLERYLQYATNFFEKALQIDKNNVYAALGIGAVLAEKGYLNEAKDVLTKVRENHAHDNDSKLSAIPETWINLGHLSMANKQYMNAAKIYENCLRKFYNNSNVDVLMFLAKAEFESGKFDEAERILQKALRIEPNRLVSFIRCCHWPSLLQVLWFDVAVSRHEHCLTILKDKKKSVTSAERAFSLLDAASILFEFVSKASKADRKKKKAGSEKAIIVKKAKHYLESILKQTRQRAEENLNAAKQEEDRQIRIKQQQMEALQQRYGIIFNDKIAHFYRQEEERRLKLEKEQKKREEEEELRKRSEENKAKLLELQEKWSSEKAAQEEQGDEVRRLIMFSSNK